MLISQIEPVEAGTPQVKAVPTIAERWRNIRNEPMFLMLLVWAFLFLLAAFVNVEA